MAFRKHSFQFGFQDNISSHYGGEDEQSRLNPFRDDLEETTILHDADRNSPYLISTSPVSTIGYILRHFHHDRPLIIMIQNRQQTRILIMT